MAFLQTDFYSETLKRNVHVNAVIPFDVRGKQRPEKPYRTLYLLHGLYDDSTGWITKTRIREIAENKGLAVILPNGDNSWYIDHKELPGNDYGRFIGEELVEATRWMFPLSEKREDTYIGGLSMGGYGALRNGLKYAGTFSRILAFSAGLRFFYPDAQPQKNGWDSYACFGDREKTVGSDLDPAWLAEQLLERQKKETVLQLPEIYMSCGTEDSLLQANRRFQAALNAVGYPLTYIESPGVHDWNFWGEYIRKGVDWLG